MTQINQQITSLYTMKLNAEKSSEINAPSTLDFTALSLQLIPTSTNEKLEAGVNQDKLNKNPAESINAQATTKVTELAKPSIPSVKLTAFVKPYINITAIGQKSNPKPFVMFISPINGM